MIPWQDVIGNGLMIIVGVVGLVAYVHTRFASKSDLKMLIDLGSSRFDALKDAVNAVDRNVTRAENRTSELTDLITRLMVSRHGGAP